MLKAWVFKQDPQPVIPPFHSIFSEIRSHFTLPEYKMQKGAQTVFFSLSLPNINESSEMRKLYGCIAAPIPYSHGVTLAPLVMKERELLASATSCLRHDTFRNEH